MSVTRLDLERGKYEQEIARLQAELADLRKRRPCACVFDEAGDTVLTLKKLQEENERLKGEVEQLKYDLTLHVDTCQDYEEIVRDLKAALTEKNAALDRAERESVLIIRVAPTRVILKCCSAGATLETPEHKPDCWWASARKAGS